MYRHGDLLIVSAPIPQDAVVTPTDILAYGEATGHHHKLVPFSLDEKYLVSEARPSGGYDAEFISGAELLNRQPVDYIGGKKGPVLFEKDGELWFRCESTVALTHQEHSTILLPPGDYRSIIQREYQPKAVPRRVID